MTDLERAIQAIEHGLLRPKDDQENPGTKMGLIERMAHYKVPGISIALIDNEKVAWTKGYGVMEAGKDKDVTTDTIFQAGSISKPVSTP